MGTARAPVFGSGRWPAWTWRVSNPNSRGCSVRRNSIESSFFNRGSAPDPGSVARGGPSPRAAPSQARCARLDCLSREKIANQRSLTGLLQQEAVVSVRGVDDMELHFLAE